MRRYFESLRPADRSAIDSVPDGLFLVRVERTRYRWHAQKPYYLHPIICLASLFSSPSTWPGV